MADSTETRTEKGISLARGPALILGTVLLAAGLYFLYKQHGFPPLAKFPNGNAPVQGKVFLGIFGANGWTGMLTAVAGGLLLFGAAQHLLAKTMSLIVGVALGAAAIIALVSGNVLGLAAANGWTKLGWGIAAAILLFNSAIPRRRRTVTSPYAGDATAAGARDRGGRYPVTRAADPATRTPDPATRTPDPASRTAEPMTRTQDPASPTAEPVTRRQDPATTGEPGGVAPREAAPIADRGASDPPVDRPR